MGSIDWSGLEVVAALLGVDDVDGLINDLMVIKSHKPESEQTETDTDPNKNVTRDTLN